MTDYRNPYAAPAFDAQPQVPVQANTSGMGKGHPLPDGVKGWSWGAFLLNWIWAIGNETWIGLLALIPYVGFVFAIWLGINGRERAWQNKRWESVEQFNEVQRKWSMWAGIIMGGMIVLMTVLVIVAVAIGLNAPKP